MRVLCTGAAGFIGSHVVKALLAEGHAVRALHLPTDDLRNLRGLDVECIAGDVTDTSTLRAAMRGREWVFHLAAIYALWTRDPARMVHVNVEGTRRVLQAAEAAGCTRVVYTSSIARFGGQGPGRRATEDSPFRLGATGDVYAQSKADAHEVAVEAAKRIDVTLVAPTGPLGPGDVGPTPTGKLLLSALTLPVPVVTRTISNFADVRDMARAHVLAAMHGQRGETYLLGSHDVALEELVRRTQALCGMTRPVCVVPFAVARGFARAATWAADTFTGKAPLLTPQAVAIAELGLAADCQKAAQELFMPTRPLDDTLRDALSWFAREGYVRDPRLRRRLLAA